MCESSCEQPISQHLCQLEGSGSVSGIMEGESGANKSSDNRRVGWKGGRVGDDVMLGSHLVSLHFVCRTPESTSGRVEPDTAALTSHVQ